MGCLLEKQASRAGAEGGTDREWALYAIKFDESMRSVLAVSSHTLCLMIYGPAAES